LAELNESDHSIHRHNTEQQLVAQSFHLLLIAPTGFGLSSWPTSGSLQVFYLCSTFNHTCRISTT